MKEKEMQDFLNLRDNKIGSILIKAAEEGILLYDLGWDEIVKAGKKYFDVISAKRDDEWENVVFDSFTQMEDFGYFILGVIGINNVGRKALDVSEEEKSKDEIPIRTRVEAYMKKYFLPVPVDGIRTVGRYLYNQLRNNEEIFDKVFGEDLDVDLFGILSTVSIRNSCGIVMDALGKEKLNESEENVSRKNMIFVREVMETIIDGIYNDDNKEEGKEKTSEEVIADVSSYVEYFLKTFVKDEDYGIIKVIYDVMNEHNKIKEKIESGQRYPVYSNNYARLYGYAKTIEKLGKDFCDKAERYENAFSSTDRLGDITELIRKCVLPKEECWRIKGTEQISCGKLLAYLGIRPNAVEKIGKKVVVKPATEKLKVVGVSKNKETKIIPNEEQPLKSVFIYNFVRSIEAVKPIHDRVKRIDNSNEYLFQGPFNRQDFLLRIKKGLSHWQRIMNLRNEKPMEERKLWSVTHNDYYNHDTRLVFDGSYSHEDMDMIERMYAISSFFCISTEFSMEDRYGCRIWPGYTLTNEASKKFTDTPESMLIYYALRPRRQYPSLSYPR